MDIIKNMREELMSKIDLLEQQKGKHSEEIERHKKKIEKAKEKETNLNTHLSVLRCELSKLDDYMKWKQE